MFTHYLDNLCTDEGVDQRTVSLRLTFLVFLYSLSVRQVSRRMVALRKRKGNDKVSRLIDQTSNPGKKGWNRVLWFTASFLLKSSLFGSVAFFRLTEVSC